MHSLLQCSSKLFILIRSLIQTFFIFPSCLNFFKFSLFNDYLITNVVFLSYTFHIRFKPLFKFFPDFLHFLFIFFSLLQFSLLIAGNLFAFFVINFNRIRWRRWSEFVINLLLFLFLDFLSLWVSGLWSLLKLYAFWLFVY